MEQEKLDRSGTTVRTSKVGSAFKLLIHEDGTAAVPAFRQGQVLARLVRPLRFLQLINLRKRGANLRFFVPELL